MTALATVPKDHDAFVAYRRTLRGLGASDVPVALNVSRFRSSFELWEELTGRRLREASTVRQRRGIRLEPVAAAWYTEQTGTRLHELHQTVRDPRFPHVFAHPDRRMVGRSGLVQIKTRWSDYPDGLVPVDVETQVTVEAELAAKDVVDVALMTFEELYVHPVVPDPETAGELCEWADAWYVRHVEGDTPPKDGSRAYSRHLDRFLREREEQGTAQQALLMAQLRNLRRQKKALEAGEETVLLALKESMPGVKRVVGEGWRINWIDVKGKTTTTWSLVAAAFRQALLDQGIAPDVLDAVESTYTSTGEPGSQFRPTWTGPEEEASDGE